MHFMRSITALGLLFLFSQSLCAQTEFPSGQLPREQLPKGRALDYEFSKVRISTIIGWLKRVNVEPPVPLSGTVSGWLWAQAPSSGWWKFNDYRVEGEITSPLLGIDRFAIRQARVRFGYLKGLWTVGTAAGQVETQAEQDPQTLGRANFAATLPTNAQGMARINGRLENVDLANLLRSLGLSDNLPAGQAQATLQIDTALANLSSPLTWTAAGHISIQQLQYAHLSEIRVDSDWTLQDAALSLNNTQVALPGANAQSLALSASMRLQDTYAWQVQLPSQLVRLNSDLYTTLVPASVSPNDLPVGTVQLVGITSGTLQPWQAQYSLNLANGQWNWLGNTLSNVQSSLSLGPAGLALDSLTFQTAGGSIAGVARFSGNVQEPLSVTLNYRDLDVALIRESLVRHRASQPANHTRDRSDPSSANASLPVMAGRVSGQLVLSVDKRNLTDMNSANVDLKGMGLGVRFGDWILGDIEYVAKKLAHQDEIEIDLQDSSQARRWLADGKLTQQENQTWTYQIDARGNALDLSVPQLIRLIGTEPQLPVPLEFVLVTGNVSLHGNTGSGLDTTEFNFSNITTLERERRIWSQGSMVGRTTKHLVEIERSRWQVAGSRIQAALRWNYLLQDQPAGAVQVASTDYLRLNVQDLKLDSLEAWHLITLPASSDGRKPLRGNLSGNLNLQRPAGASSWLTDWSGQVELDVEQLTLHQQTAGHVKVVGSLTPNQLETQLSGELLNAPLAGRVSLVLQQQPALTLSSASGRVTWLGAEISQLVGLWQARDQAFQWRGLANLRMQFDWNSQGRQNGQADLDISQLSYRQRNVIRNLQAVAALDKNRIRLVRFDGGLSGGRIDLTGGFDLSTRSLEDVAVQLQRVSLAELAQLIDPEWNQQLTGRADMRARVHVHSGLDVHGDLRLHDAAWIGLPIDELHTGFELTSPMDGSLIRLRAANARGRMFGGRAEADLQARFGSRNALDLRLRVNRGEVDQLSKWTHTSSVVGKGKFDADLTLASSDVRAVRDLRGDLVLTFQDTNARTLPVADQLARFVPLFAVPSTEFENGTLSATISQGDLRMRSLALWGRQLSVLGSGNVGMSTGRLDLQLVIRTGGGLSQLVAANYLSQLAATAVPEVELLLQINRLIANRAIFLRVAGTASQPVIQPQAARMIERALVRSLLEQAVAVGPAVSVSTR